MSFVSHVANGTAAGGGGIASQVWDSVANSTVNNWDTAWSVVTNFNKEHHAGLEALCIVVGLVVAFCGRVILRPVVFMGGFLPFFGLCWSAGHSLFNDNDPDVFSQTEIYVMVAALIAGLILGFGILKVFFNGAVVLICGTMGGVLVLVASLYLPRLPYENAETVLALAGLCGFCVCAGLALCHRETMAIFGTAFDGTALATYFLADFMGKQPKFLPSEDDQGLSHAWRAFYATFVIGLGLFASLMQLRLYGAEQTAATLRLRKQEELAINRQETQPLITRPEDVEMGGGDVKSPPHSHDDDYDYDSMYQTGNHLGTKPLPPSGYSPFDGPADSNARGS